MVKMQKAIMDRIFVKEDAPQQGAFIIEVNNRTRSGIVQSVGEQVKSVKVGDHVVFCDWAELDALDGLTAIREKYLLGVITDE